MDFNSRMPSTNSTEQTYRQHLQDTELPLLVEALDYVVPPDATSDDPAAELARQLCFSPARFDFEQTTAFAERCQMMMTHGVRQIALIKAVLEREAITDELPAGLNSRLLCQAALVADVGLAFVSEQEVKLVHKHGPKWHARGYHHHPAFAYAMAQELGADRHESTAFVAAFAARHHMIQAKNAYGLEWNDITSTKVSESQVDLAVSLVKPFDYFDDSVDRQVDKDETYASVIDRPLARFVGSTGLLLTKNLSYTASMVSGRYDLGLPNRLALAIGEAVQDPSEPISAVYRAVVESNRLIRQDQELDLV
jgi:hypothetical protein